MGSNRTFETASSKQSADHEPSQIQLRDHDDRPRSSKNHKALSESTSGRAVSPARHQADGFGHPSGARLNASEVKDQAEIARTAEVTRARVTQILNLTNLAPHLQQTLLELEPTTDAKSSPREKDVRQIAIEPNWIKRRKAWKRMLSLREREQAQQQRNRATASHQATLG